MVVDVAIAPAKRPQLTGDPIVPVPGESLRSIVARTCRENGLPNSFGLLGPLGLLHRNKVRVSEGTDIDPADLAHAMNLSEHEVTSRRYEALDLGYVDFFGMQVNKTRINNTVRRFAPTALGVSPHHRALWELRDLPFCPESWDMLIDTCPCPTEPNSTVQRWTRTGSRVSECDRCGNPLHELPSQIVPPHVRKNLTVLRELLTPEIDDRDLTALLPKEIAHTERGRIFDCLRLMSEIAIGGRIEGLDDPFGDAVLRWERACKALRAWPIAFPGNWIAQDTGPSAYAYRHEIYLDLGNEPGMTLVEYKKKTRTKKDAVHQRTSRPKQSAEDRERRRRAKRAAEREQRPYPPTQRKIGLRPASEAAKLDPETLLKAQAEEMLRKFERQHGPRTLPAFDREEVIRFGRNWNARIPVSKVAFDFEISHYGVEQLAALGILNASAPRFEEEGPHFTQQDIDLFRNDLLAHGTTEAEDWVTLQEAMRAIDDRPKPWGPAIRMMLNGDIAYRIPPGFSFLLPRMEMRRADLPIIAGLRFETRDHGDTIFSPLMVQRDVCELFNLKESKADAISFLTSSGTMPKRYSREQVEAERARILSHTELARRFSTTWQKVSDRLNSAQLDCTAGNYFDRERAMAVLTATRRH